MRRCPLLQALPLADSQIGFQDGPPAEPLPECRSTVDRKKNEFLSVRIRRFLCRLWRPTTRERRDLVRSQPDARFAECADGWNRLFRRGHATRDPPFRWKRWPVLQSGEYRVAP